MSDTITGVPLGDGREIRVTRTSYGVSIRTWRPTPQGEMVPEWASGIDLSRAQVPLVAVALCLAHFLTMADEQPHIEDESGQPGNC